MLAAAPAASGQELYVLSADGQTLALADAPAVPANGRPVLFVHGHNAQSTTDDDFNYRKNWVEPLGSLPSFSHALLLPENSTLDIEAYFIRFADQTRSITEDAAELRAALGLILQRHDPDYDPADASSDTDIQIALIAYSKGTLSSRLALKSLVESVEGLASPQPDLKPVSEFIAIAPPNHGLRTLAALLGSAVSGDEMNNGYGPPVLGGTVCAPIGEDSAEGFIERLNGHDMADSHADAVPLAEYPSEAPGSRSPGAPSTDGVLYVSLYASGNRDFVGGDVPPGASGNDVETQSDCNLPVQQGRVLARNLAPDAINLALTSITGNDAIEVHSNTVHTGAVICQALHTAVHGHPPVEGECQVSPGIVPVISPPRRVAVQLVLDYSMSMQHPACAVCAPKFTTLTQAAQLFVDLWDLVAAPGDYLGVTEFRSEVTQMSCHIGQPCTSIVPGNLAAGSTLVPLKQHADAIRDHLGSQVPGGTTAMGGALQSALADLAAFDGERKRILLFTDGMQNVSPRVETIPADCAAGDCALAIAGDPPQTLDPSLDVVIDTIGVGAGDAYLSLLSDIALATGGVSRTTLNPDEDLQAYFVDDVIDVLQGYSPQRVARRRGVLTGDVHVETFPVNHSATRVIFHWPGNVEARIVKDDVDVTALGRRIVRPGYRLWTLSLPASVEGRPLGSGDWQVQLSGRAGQAFDVSALVDESVLDFSVSTGTRRYRVGDSLDLSVSIRAAGAQIDTPADVSVRVWRPGSSAANLIATAGTRLGSETVNLEPGVSIAQQNLARFLRAPQLRAELTTTTSSLPMTTAGNGQYTTASAPLTVPGSYRVEFHLAGDHPAVGRFERTRSQTVHVEFATADFESTGFSAARRQSKGNESVVELVVSPRDSYGNYLGPGYASRVAGIVDGEPQGAPEDLGDGRYAFAIDGDTPRSARLELRVMGEALLEGHLSDVEPPPPLPRRPLWQYGIAILLLLLTVWLFRRRI